jgi:hypothetical protein
VKTRNRQQLLLIGAAIALALLAGDRLVLDPLTGLWKARSVRIAELQESISKGSLLVEREATIRERWQEMRANSLPANMSVAENEVFRAFDRWSQDSRVSITSIRPQWRRAGEDYTVLECRADASGTIQALSRFLYNVEKDPLPLKIEAVEIVTRDERGQQLSLALHVTALLLHQPTQ